VSIELLVIIGIIFISILLGVIFLIPGERKKKKEKKRKKEIDNQPSENEKILELKISRLEKHIQSLHNEILDLQKRDKDHEKQAMVQNVKVKKLQEKISQERQWHEKEQSGIDKKGKEFQKLKTELIDVQEGYSKAHSSNLRFEYQMKELQGQVDSLNEQRRTVEEENVQLTAKNKNDKQEIAHLKSENVKLAKKNENVDWVAKTEYQRVEKLLKEKEKELDRVARNKKE